MIGPQARFPLFPYTTFFRFDRRGVAAQHDRHGHLLSALRHLPPVGRSHLVALPVHRELAPADHLDAVHTDVADARSEEHTSELQSRSDLVCRLLLEKKKK